MMQRSFSIPAFLLGMALVVTAPADLGGQQKEKPLAPLSAGDWDARRAAHLLDRAGFGGSPEQIEHDYHEDGALPKMPRSECYHMKDVVVHPATALALLAQPEPDREQVHNEIFEVVTHAMAVRTGVGFNSADGD